MDAQSKDEDSGKFNPFTQDDFPAIIEVLELRIKSSITLLVFGNDSKECGNLACSFGDSLSKYCKKIFFHFIRYEDPLVEKFNIKAFPALKVLKNSIINKIEPNGNIVDNTVSLQNIDPISVESFGITKYGLPIGYDLAAILNLIVDVSSGIADLSEKIVEKLNSLKSQM